MPNLITIEPIVGSTVVAIRPLTATERDQQGWTQDLGIPDRDVALAIVFSNGTLVFASRDPEGNGPGVLFGHHQPSGKDFYLEEEA
jgi:hypothetical protein